MELSILSGLNWRMLPITPFYFLDHYYPTFSEIGGFKRRSINEIIVQSQGGIYIHTTRVFGFYIFCLTLVLREHLYFPFVYSAPIH